jgi:formylmethanofuran dehydrogenase subunit E
MSLEDIQIDWTEREREKIREIKSRPSRPAGSKNVPPSNSSRWGMWHPPSESLEERKTRLIDLPHVSKEEKLPERVPCSECGRTDYPKRLVLSLCPACYMVIFRKNEKKRRDGVAKVP